MAKFTKPEKSWALYDWGSSAYSIIITTAVFPLFYKAAATEAGVELADSTAYLSYTIAIFTFILAMLGPLLGTIADYEGMKKKFFTVFFVLGTVSTAMLAFVPEGQWLWLLICYVFAALGATGANLFYDAFIVDVTTSKRMNQVSAFGYGLGYIGSTIPFALAILIILLAQNEILPLSVTNASRLAFLITAAWWILFSIPLFRHVKQQHFIKREANPVVQSFRRLNKTIREIRQYRALFLFLIAYFFYIDGVGTIISLSTAYGTDLGLSATSLLIVLFATQVVAAPFAILYGKLADRFTGKKMLYVGIFVYIIVCVYAVFIETIMDFWILAMLVATSQGGIQALSRSYFGKLVPKQNANEFFGFYNIFGKFAAITGPLLVGVTSQITGNSSLGVLSLVVLFIIGLVVLIFVPEPVPHEPVDEVAAE
ncbi:MULTISPECIES: MFS transporter [unclassified Planococcus (in: firmicutes)]|uniref:MFS transporter n=1 Tax=unclassified Planococcus (in: firmicutes) TaxID=2662419 RepID=UPI000C34BC0F|nr:MULTISPECIES: MFS transporter [unclassified Planococcus (in: firmicutes)]AUD14862.1 MFS transporter [Planococcus sp. MB-3u-03]PKG45185.1 MFS transporter [Planococcus sp. Urea-trap-24]PKG87527.1 MFS transporter [Planococcus sp. Urea-3u-39]PKH41519.1 MFS transporter [Planococcus sp. MB-3u-09]